MTDQDEVSDRDEALNILVRYFDDKRAEVPEDVRAALEWLDNENEQETATNRRLHIGVAVTYIAMCKAGIIANTQPLATVRDCYGLADTDVVKKWVRRYKGGVTFVGGPVPGFCETPPIPVNVGAIQEASMELHGYWYRQL